MQPTIETPSQVDAALLRQAEEVDLDVGLTDDQTDGQELSPGGAPPPDYFREAQGAVDLLSTMLVGYCPDCADVWTPEARARVSAAMVPVMEKYGFSFGHLPPELTLLIVAGPPIYQSTKLLSAHIEAKRKAAQAEKSKPGPGVIRPTSDASEGPQVSVHPQMGLYGQ